MVSREQFVASSRKEEHVNSTCSRCGGWSAKQRCAQEEMAVMTGPYVLSLSISPCWIFRADTITEQHWGMLKCSRSTAPGGKCVDEIEVQMCEFRE